MQRPLVFTRDLRKFEVIEQAPQSKRRAHERVHRV